MFAIQFTNFENCSDTLQTYISLFSDDLYHPNPNPDITGPDEDAR
jgi:hypothetical protein